MDDRPAAGRSDASAAVDETAGGVPRPSFRRLGHAGVWLPGPPRIVVDPWRLGPPGLVADLALVTHEHIDHCSPDDLRDVLAPDAPVVAPAAAALRLRDEFGPRVHVVAEGDDIVIAGARVRVLPAEGPPRGGRSSGFHPRGRGVSYLVESAGESFLFLGDSLPLREHAGFAPDVAFVAVGGLVTATPDEAAAPALALGARLLVPVHWGDLEARHGAARRFAELTGSSTAPPV